MALPLSAATLTPTTATGGSRPASMSPCKTPTWAAPRAPPPPSTHVRRVGPKINALSPLLPRREVLLLLLGQGVDGDPHRAQLELRNLGVDVVRHVIHATLQLASVTGHVLGAQRLVGKAHVHHRSRMALSRGQVDQPSLAQHVQAAAVAEPVLLDVR